MTLIDTHAHLFDDRFRSDLPAVLRRAADAGVERTVCIGIDRESSIESVRLANQHPLLVAAVGIQPNHAAEAQPGDWDAVVRLAETEPRVVAVGIVRDPITRAADRAATAFRIPAR